ncbi:hypothetical protein Dsin_025036 [Dipteronia sinensis]|uniref:Myb/SANT-like domain-containing protein n=1 Tax=Dipteronia sinensis TaxID=43782 RepID=A0AAE0DWR1_9ROSI|nr:hypothetical protein Dsin_025036 [Dipteronia sinensis]
MMEAKLPICGLKTSPHIESQVKTLKAKYCALHELLSQGGFGWNDEHMMLMCEKHIYDEWVKSMEFQSQGTEDFEISSSQPPSVQRCNSMDNNVIVSKRARIVRNKTTNELHKDFSNMASAIAAMTLKLDGLINVYHIRRR